jgi:hypothetical protein
LAALLVGGAFIGARLNLLDPDTWWHLKVGQQILAERRWPTADAYSFTVAGNHWMAYEWLGEVVMGLSARAGGLRAPTMLLVGLSAALLLLLYSYATLRSGNCKAAFVACAVLLPEAAAFFTLRPQLLGYIFVLITMICLEQFRRGRRWVLWALPLLFLLWVNTHGTFVFGLLILGLSWAGGQVEFRKGGLVARRWTAVESRQLAWVLLLCVLVLPLTPYGTRLAAYPLQISLSQPVSIANIQEWQPLAFSLFLGKLFLGLLLVFFLVQLMFPIHYRWEDVILLLFAIFAACTHLRFILLFLVFFVPLLAMLLARWLPAYDRAKDRFVLNAVLIACVAVGIVARFPSRGELRDLTARRYPQQAVGYIRQHPVPGRMFNEYGWGGYLIWSLSPERKVFIDGRADIYEEAGVLSDYLSISWLDPQTLFLLRKYGIEACLVRHDAPLGTFLAALPDWERVYADKVSALYVRRGQPGTPRPGGTHDLDKGAASVRRSSISIAHSPAVD